MKTLPNSEYSMNFHQIQNPQPQLSSICAGSASFDTTLSIFEEQAVKNAWNLAAIAGDKCITYKSLNERANQMASYLVCLGIQRGDFVAIYLDNSLEMLIALLGIWKAQAAYIPISEDYPYERIKFVIEDSKAFAVITDHVCSLQKLPPNGSKIICLNRDQVLINTHSVANLNLNCAPEDIANLMYTSGTTGNPKGVLVPHRGIYNYLQSIQQEHALSMEERVLLQTPFTFDIAAIELFGPLIIGARLVMAKPRGHQDREHLVCLMNEHQITTLNLVPSTLRLLLEDTNFNASNSLKRVLCGGDVLGYDLKEAFLERFPQVELYNYYGPTECSIYSTFWKCQADAICCHVPIGKPVANTQLHVLDARQQPVPVGEIGELYIAGAGVASGYLNRSELTAEKFLADPFSKEPNARMYRTGDLVRYMSDGNLEFLERVDNQVKIQGFRIELDEIRLKLLECSGITDAVIVDREDPATQSKFLVAFVIIKDAAHKTDSAVYRKHLQESLPHYMIPSHFVALDKIPLTLHGKIDTKVLRKVDLTPIAPMSSDKPNTVAEKDLLAIWSKVLNNAEIGIHDNFFTIGGHSLLAIRMVSRIRETFQTRVSIRDIFNNPTIAELGKAIEQAP